MPEFNKDAIQQLNRITAQKIFEKMRILRMSPTENSKRRWIWELLQNAKDKAAIDFPEEKVAVLINYDNDSVIFKHNLGYFTEKNIEGLIRQISSDDKDREDTLLTEKPQTTGRFGTGFMTTHLLSEKVRVQGLYHKEEQSFVNITFPLDRSGRTLNDLIESINSSFEEAEQSVANAASIDNPNFDDLNTIFTYNLDEKGKKIAEIGLKDLEIALSYTLIFIDRIKSVKISYNNQEIIYHKNLANDFNTQIKLAEFDKITNGNLEKLCYVFLTQNLTTIALPIKIDGQIISLQPLNHKLPRLFLDFPLIGTENFHFPVITNNPFLEPTEPRDGIFLTDENEDHIIHNKTILEEAVSLYLILLDHACSQNWQSLYFLADTKLPQSKDWISESWYKEKVQKVLREKLMVSEIVYTDDKNNPKIKLEDTLFPCSNTLEKTLIIWDFAQAFWLDSLPKKEHLPHWFEIIDTTWTEKIRYTLDKLVKDIASFSSLNQLCDRINKTEIETLDYLTEVIQFVNQEKPKLLDQFAIIPNQHGNFKLKKELWFDDNIPNHLKDILTLLSEDWRINLKHNLIKLDDLAISKKILDIIIRINQIIRDNQHPNLKTAILHLISCSPPDSKNSSEIYQLRQLFWKFATEFYSETPKQKYLGNWDLAIWKECDQWFIKALFIDIANQKTMINLNTHLQQDGYQWLSHLINFVVDQNIFDPVTLIKEAQILPSQEGNLQKVSSLFIDDNIDETLKDIADGLGYNCRSELLDNLISLNPDVVKGMKIKKKTVKDIAKEIVERVQSIWKEEIKHTRTQRNKEIFEELFLWFYDNEEISKEYFKDLYDKRHRLRTDEEIIKDIKFKQDVLNNSNGYSEEEIINLVNIRKDKLLVVPDDVQITQEELQHFIEEKRNQEKAKEADQLNEFSPDELLLSLGINCAAELQRAKSRFYNTYIGRCLGCIPSTYNNFDYVHSIIERAKQNVRRYLMQHPDYNCDNWYEESLTVISGITKQERPIKIVVRPSDSKQVIIYYDEEYDTLESPDAELWTDNNYEQKILTLGKILKCLTLDQIRKYAGTTYIKIP